MSLTFDEKRNKHYDFLEEKYGEIVKPSGGSEDCVYEIFVEYKTCHMCGNEDKDCIAQNVADIGPCSGSMTFFHYFVTCPKESCQEKLKDHLDLFAPSEEVLKERYSFVLGNLEKACEYLDAKRKRDFNDFKEHFSFIPFNPIEMKDRVFYKPVAHSEYSDLFDLEVEFNYDENDHNIYLSLEELDQLGCNVFKKE